jgi:hypothetical protein
MSEPSQPKTHEAAKAQAARMRERANEITKELRDRYRGYDAIGPKEIADEVNRRTTARRTTPKSIANALREGIIHDGTGWPIAHRRKTIWSVPIDVAAISIAEMVGGGLVEDWMSANIRKWVVVSVAVAPIEIRGAATDIMSLNYDPARSVGQEQAADPHVAGFLEAIANELDRIGAEQRARDDLAMLRGSSGLDDVVTKD